jgi:putative Mn2+ efflux pump MntP
MSLAALLALAVALAMDAFAVALVTGLSLRPLRASQLLRMSLAFGLFQAGMPVLGWFAGKAVHGYISAVDHWIAFGLLAIVGGKMVYEAIRGDDDQESNAGDSTRGMALIILAIATSIDALAVGLSLSMIGQPIAFPALVIGLVCAGFTATGMLLGRRIGAAWGPRVNIFGGLILIGIGVKILVEHLGG